MPVTTETLVIGASAAGLATAAELRKRGRPFEIVEAEDVVAGSWRRQYDRLHLHTPKRFSGLPGLAMPKGWPKYPARDQVVEYLESYQQHFALQPHFGEAVRRVERQDGTWETTTDKGVWRSDNVVVATGRARVAVRPAGRGWRRFGHVLHSSEFRNGDPWKGRPVLVVGFGNSACEQALDLVERGAEVHLAVRSPVNVLPRDVLGLVPVLSLGIVMRHLPSRGCRRPCRAHDPDDDWRRDARWVCASCRTARTPRSRSTTRCRCWTSAPWSRSSRDASRSTVRSNGSARTAWSSRTVRSSPWTRSCSPPDTGPLSPTSSSGWEAVCDSSGTPTRSGGPTTLAGLYFCGMYVSPAGMLREIGIEAKRIAAHIAT